MDEIKEAFVKVKRDVRLLQESLLDIHAEHRQLKEEMNALLTGLKAQLEMVSQQLSEVQSNQTNSITLNSSPLNVKNTPHEESVPEIATSTQRDTFMGSSFQQTDNKQISVEEIGKKRSLEALKSEKVFVSTGNGGVSTDRQTDRQTDRIGEIPSLWAHTNKYTPIDDFKKAEQLLTSLDGLKTDIVKTFHALTAQEMHIFATLYSLEDNGLEHIDYMALAQAAGLTESSIRDYISRLVKKGIPITKIKVNNKKIYIKVADRLRKIAPLATILRVRDL